MVKTYTFARQDKIKDIPIWGFIASSPDRDTGYFTSWLEASGSLNSHQEAPITALYLKINIYLPFEHTVSLARLTCGYLLILSPKFSPPNLLIAKLMLLTIHQSRNSSDFSNRPRAPSGCSTLHNANIHP
ncbi:hypothetical protein CDAR_114351 [Caerostris darwini]|uniref:Uncharacterized protein n=1 Tax=Caerostris darwini TaxID=1538125 RepID=A0AAV4T0V7_9ARAC|nr:hypothetical protein CDAR_114351 [Caerostris darwini]